MKKTLTYQRTIQYFLQGLLILGPVSITLYFIYIVFDKIDGLLRPAINFPGLGFIIIIAFQTLKLSQQLWRFLKLFPI
jgi:uncharacterized membrane protein